jgi:hypothetical protein
MLLRACSTTDNGSAETVLQVLTQSPRRLYGNALVRRMSVKPVLITFFRVKRWIRRRGMWSIDPDLLT